MTRKSPLLILALLASLLPATGLAQTFGYTEGEQLKAVRQFVTAEVTFDGPLVYQFAASDLDTEANATLALNETLLSYESPESSDGVLSFNIVSGPKLYDASTWYVAKILSEGYELQMAAVIFRIGSFVELWSVTSQSGSQISSLEDIADVFEVVVPANVTAENILSTLPGMTEIPAGFYLNEETVEAGDAAAA